MNDQEGRPLTGRMVLTITLSAFAVIIGANMALLWAAIGSFPGLEVKNSYVASQVFDEERAAQEALGWTAEVSYETGRLTLKLADQGGLVTPAELTGIVGRATHEGDDQVLAFRRGAQGYSAPLRLDEGHWQVRLQAVAQGGTRFSRRLPLFVPSAE